MSRTRDTGGSSGPTNPTTLYAEWDSIEPRWKYWNKDAEKEEALPISTPFIVLDQLHTAKGYNEPKQKGYWSNEVRNLKDTLFVKSKDGSEAEGTWKELKAGPLASFIKYTKSVYVLAKIGDAYQLANFQLKGAALTAWIEFVESVGGDKALYNDLAITVSSYEEKKKGAVRYNSPVFSVASRELSSEAAEQANKADAQLQAYLDEYLDSPKGTEAVDDSDHYADTKATEAVPAGDFDEVEQPF